MAKNPFTIEVEAANKAAFEEFVAAASLSGDAAKTKLVQAGILTDAAMELTLASIEWRSGRLEMAIKRIGNISQGEAGPRSGSNRGFKTVQFCNCFIN